ncbi:hypothetical protein CDV31_014167 [Fusarium ambrosium]|uniref:Uncharacterized protein n=1 Tax=Fusarium ambrosium TaxID=131363 RepID=A0A428SYD0_9HYPO|nr:hypothetical protein CDV31_014167 [Fusarium ambrosium]
MGVRQGSKPTRGDEENNSQCGKHNRATVLALGYDAMINLGRVLASISFSESGIRNAIAGAESDLFRHLSDEVRDEVVLGITKDMQKGFGMVVTSGALTIAAGLLMKFENLSSNALEHSICR